MDLVEHSQQEREMLTESVNKNKESGEKASELEKKYVYEVYDRIASHFSNTRHTAWPRIENFLSSLEQYSVLADIGCGNGKYLNTKIAQNNLFSIGMDRSEGLLKCAKEINREFQLFSADSLKLPFKSESVDNVISIVIVYHFSNEIRRKQILTE